MSIDRKKFMMLALSLSMGTAACTPKNDATENTTPENKSMETTPADESAMPADENAMPADECVDWDATNECIGWAGDSAMPADECVDWDATNECIGWAGDAPAGENW